MIRILAILISTITLFASCRSTKKIQTAIAKKDTTAIVIAPPVGNPRQDSINFIQENYAQVQKIVSALPASQLK